MLAVIKAAASSGSTGNASAWHCSRRTTARSTGTVERPFRTIKKAHETLYHFDKPETEFHLALAFEAGYRTGEKTVSAALVESALSRQLDDLKPTLTRHGYRIKDLVEEFDARPAEIDALFSNSLQPERAATLRDKMLSAGLPI